ncbi:MAG: zinc ABC transporter permease [Proteobacteria bacterium]|nr:MAG: zinc ABC transporter permease [Pseudomonadota bacterium]
MEFIFNGLVAGLSLAVVAGPLGCFVVWRRMSYFGDTMAHSALLGITLGLLFSIDLTLAVIAVSVGIASLLTVLMKSKQLASDTLLGILAHSSLALGLIALSFMPDVRVDINGFLFGDLLAVSTTDVFWSITGGVLVLAIIRFLWLRLLMITIDEDLARVEGQNVGLLKFVLLLLISVVIAIAIKIVGVLLITSMLIIPAATARRIARTPESMALIASGLGVVSVITGFSMSYFLDTPVGPSIVSCGFFLFLLIYIVAPEKHPTL